MAINLYLAEKYGKNSLWPAEPAAHADIYKWSFWALTEVEPHLMTILRNRVMNPPEQRDEKAAQAAVEALKAPLNVLEQSLKGREYLLGKNFTIADLNVAAVMSWAPWAGSQ
jgi:glutathione S-transferase